MKKFLLIFLLFPYVLFAQDFRNIITSGRTFYTDSINNPGYLAGIKTDSILSQGNGDTIFLANNTIRPYPGHALLDTVGGILGRTIYKKSDGWFYFFNAANDTLYINSQASLNESWKFCNLPDNGYLKATCSSVYSTTVLGTAETVKELTFQAKNSSGQDIPDFYNDQHILLGRKYGFITIFDLHHMPDTSAVYSLAGRNQPAIGFQGLTWQEVYDFEVGDEFHYTGRINSAVTSHHITDDYNQIRKVLTKDAHPELGYVTYTFENCMDEITQGFGPPSEQYTHDTLPGTYPYTTQPADPATPFMPEQFIQNGTRYYSTLFHTIPGRPSNGYIAGYYNCCWNYCLPPYYCYTNEQEYFQGLGKALDRNIWTFFNITDHDYDILVYYKKGNETWGSPVSTDCSTLMPYLAIQPDTLILQSQKGSSDTLFVSSNREWQIVNPYSIDWLEYYPVSGNGNGHAIFSSTSANTDQAPRYAYLGIEGTPGSRTYFVKQLGGFSGIENNSQAAVSVSPNPVKTVADISIPGFPPGRKAVLTLSDLMGRIAFQATFTPPLYRFNRGQIPSGMYILKISSGIEDLWFKAKIILE